MHVKRTRVKWVFLLLCLYLCSDTGAQLHQEIIATHLEPFVMKGRKHPLRRNISFAGYHTSHIARSFGSIFFIRNLHLLNTIFTIDGIPLLTQERQRRRDVFQFSLVRNDGGILRVECKAFFRKNETFRLLHRQDSSFRGSKNVDVLVAGIECHHDSTQRWRVLATNLNASKHGEQGGVIRSANDQVVFKLGNLVLTENAAYAGKKYAISTLHLVYAFSYKGETVAAVSAKEKDRKFWVLDTLEPGIKDVIAAVAAILTIRQNLYD